MGHKPRHGPSDKANWRQIPLRVSITQGAQPPRCCWRTIIPAADGADIDYRTCHEPATALRIGENGGGVTGYGYCDAHDPDLLDEVDGIYDVWTVSKDDVLAALAGTMAWEDVGP